ncbi:MAG: tetratricopeptide repeat protein [Patescibacteria group bacterium]
MDSNGILEQQAIEAAISNDWDSAINLNQQILEQDEGNLGAYLRLGFAYLQSSKISEAGQAYRSALKLHPKHPIASENLERIKILEQKKVKTPTEKERKTLDPNLFLDVPGKTKTVQLVNLGQKIHLAELSIGQEVELKQKKRKIEVRSLSGNYLGALPDDISKRILFFLEAESTYRTFIKEASLSRILIFIKEIMKGSTVSDYVSFPQSTQPLYHPLHPSENEQVEDDEDKDQDWDDDASNDDEEEKHDLLHINTHDDDDSEEE